jgi:hypothetical protein
MIFLIDSFHSPNLYFIAGMFFLFILAIFLKIFFPSSQRPNDIPTYLTTIGIVGTFFGLYLSLKDFDSGNIEGSIPHLLEGLKTKFLVSLWGVGLSLVLKISLVFLNSRTKSNTASGSSLDDVVNSIHNLGNVINNNLKQQNDNLVLLRSDFSNFSQNMAEQNSEAFIKALSEVIRDFNTQINEQFGDNFKQLNQAVGKLLDWQENNKSEMSRILELLNGNSNVLDKANETLAVATSSMDSAHKQIALVKEICHQLEPVMRSLHEDSTHTRETVRSLNEFSFQMKQVLPEFKVNIDQIVNAASSGLSRFNEGLEKTYNMQLSEMDKANKKYVELASSSRAILEKSIIDNCKLVSAQVEQLSKDQTEIIKKQLTAIDKGLEEELMKALESMGNSLASLSEKFVSDYTPLTEKLTKLVQASRAG